LTTAEPPCLELWSGLRQPRPLTLTSTNRAGHLAITSDGVWLQVNDARRRLYHGELLELDGQTVVLSLLPSSPEPKLLAQASLSVRYWGDDQTDLQIAWRGEVHQLRGHRRAELLAELADKLVQDRRRNMDAKDQGWVSRSRLCRALDVEQAHLNSILHRLRRSLELLGFADHSEVIESRFGALAATAGSSQLRLRMVDVTIE